MFESDSERKTVFKMVFLCLSGKLINYESKFIANGFCNFVFLA